MAQAIKSVLLLDFDSVFRSLGRNGAGVADLFASRAGAWLEGLESGELLGPQDDEERRRFQFKRCYADPKALGKNRGWLTANGVQIVECAQLSGISKGSSATHLILDALDSMEPEPEEVILLVADIDLTPLVFRLKARRQRVVLYATAETPPSYRALADAVVEEATLLRAISRQPEAATPARGAIPRPPRMAAPEPRRVAPPTAPAAAARRPEPAPAAAVPARRPAVDRDALAALVRRIHQATSVPLFSPKAFADLFRLLVEEVSANGYKFQSTSENVANGMNALGRNVTKRQVGFVIKGLALRGHVFNEGDKPDQLAEAFYEQVLFLAENAKVILTDAEKGLVLAWVVGLRREAPAPVAVEPRAVP
ncbi:MAG: NYN domain-containing protein, partial [Bauldia sp.]|nr:NYN domain-containing protein [Bauldia sp.]